MRYLLLLSIVLVSLCAGLPDIPFEIPFFNTQNTTIQKAGIVTMDAESPDVFLRAEIVPIEIRAGRDTAIFFELMNKNNYDLKNVSLLIYDPCIFSGETEKNIGELKSNRTIQWSWNLKSSKTDLDKDCNIKFRLMYEADYTTFQDIAVLTSTEYQTREVSGTLSTVPIQTSSSVSPLRVPITFSDEQPFIDNESYYMNLDYYKAGIGVIEVENISIVIPNNLKNVSCNDYNFVPGIQNILYLNRKLNFINNRAAGSSCIFNTTTAEPMNIKSLAITGSYKYILDNSITIRVKKA